MEGGAGGTATTCFHGLQSWALRHCFLCALQTDPGSEAPPGRGGAACCAIGGRRILVYGGADRSPAAFDDWWVLELTESGGHWTKVSPVVKLTHK